MIAVLAACTDVPEPPSFQQHVQPILAANCARCHMPPAIGGAPDLLLTFVGTPEHAQIIRDRVVAGDMPPRLPLGDDEIETIDRWYQLGGQRGEARPGNRAPNATVLVVTGTDLFIEVTDADGDLVGGELLGNGTSLGWLTQGRNRITLEPGTYALTTQLDDGGALAPIDLGTVRATR